MQPGNNAPVWREVRSGKEGVTTVKGRETGVLIQTWGETWRKLRNGPITLYGGWLVVLVLIALGLSSTNGTGRSACTARPRER